MYHLQFKKEKKFTESTVKPLYNDICYNTEIRYNVDLARKKSADRTFLSLLFPCCSSGNIRFVYLLESPCRGDSNEYTKRMIHIFLKYPLFMF